MNSFHRVAVAVALLSLQFSAVAAVSATVEARQVGYTVHTIGAPTGVLPSLTFGDTLNDMEASVVYQAAEGSAYSGEPVEDLHNAPQQRSNGSFLTALQAASQGKTGEAGGEVHSGNTATIRLHATQGDLPLNSQLAQRGSATESVWSAPEDKWNFTLSPRSYVTFSMDTTLELALSTPAAQPSLQQSARAEMSLTLTGPGTNGQGEQRADAGTSLYLSEEHQLPQRSQTHTWSANFYNFTDAPMQGSAVLRGSANAQIYQPSTPVPEADAWAMALVGLTVAGAALRRRARIGRRAGRQAAAMGVLLGMGSVASATPLAFASLGFGDIAVTAGDLDPSDAYSPTLTVREAGSFANTSSASAIWQDAGTFESEHAGTDDLTAPQGGLLDFQHQSAGINHGGANMLSLRDEGGMQLSTVATAGTNGPDQITNTSAGFELAPQTPASEETPYSFTLSPMSYATFSMQLTGETRVLVYGEDGGTAKAYAFWQIGLMEQRGPGDSNYSWTVLDEGRLSAESTGKTEDTLSKVLTYSIANTSTSAMNGVLYFTAKSGAIASSIAVSPPPLMSLAMNATSAVPEPRLPLLVLAGMAVMGLVKRRPTRRAEA
jgi:hypothetical protein